MDVPFLSSGALSRAHYALVRNVEVASSPPIADQYLLQEVEDIRDRLAHPISAVGSTDATCQGLELTMVFDVEANERMSHHAVILLNELHRPITRPAVCTPPRPQSRGSR